MTPIRWKDWPPRRQPTRSLAAVGLIFATVLAIATLDPWLAVVGAVVLAITTSEALLPTRYEISETGIRITRPFSRRSQDWGRFRGWRIVPEGVVVLGEGSRPMLRRVRTVVLRCPEVDPEVTAALARHIPCLGDGSDIPAPGSDPEPVDVSNRQ